VIELDVLVEDARWSALGDAGALAHGALEAAVAVADGAEADAGIEVVLSHDAAVQALNRLWRGQDRPTNVLSFPAAAAPGAPGPRHLGGIVLAYETVRREADAERKTLRDHALHLIVHGALHLIGYDHETGPEAEIMEALETRALARIGVADPYGPA